MDITEIKFSFPKAYRKHFQGRSQGIHASNLHSSYPSTSYTPTNLQPSVFLRQDLAIINNMSSLQNLTLGQLIDKQASKNSRKDALVFPDLNYRKTYEEFKNEIDQAAKGLLALNIQKGEHIGIFAVNCPEWVILQFAAAKVGAVLVNINPALKTYELKYILEQGDITTVFLTEFFKTQNMIHVLKELEEKENDTLAFKDLPLLKKVITIRCKEYENYLKWTDLLKISESINDSELDERQKSISPNDIVNIQYTSGTTGNPKGAQLTHLGILNNSYSCGENMNLTSEDSICIPVPLYHCFGCVLGTLTCVNYGLKMVFPSEVFNPQKTLKAVHEEKCTALYGVPTMFIAELGQEDFNNYDLSSLRTGVIAGAPCPMELMKQLIEKMNLKEITIGYGFTEASPLLTQTKFNDPLEVKVGTVGSALQNVKIKIIDPDTEEPIGVNDKGELCGQGYNAMIGYYKMPEQTSKVLRNGWMHTGDLATVDENGVYKIVGRIKDMIIRGGENIYPAELEDFLMTHEKIEQVQVIGLPDNRFGEQVAAIIKLKPGQESNADKIKSWCKGKIADYKIPFYIVFASDFPMTANGKVQKYKLREMLIDELKLSI